MDQKAQPEIGEAEYQAIEAALMGTARGRRFLAEHARRNRAADTRLLLDAIRRLERAVLAGPAAPEPVREEPAWAEPVRFEPEAGDDLFDDGPAEAPSRAPRTPSPELLELREQLRRLS